MLSNTELRHRSNFIDGMQDKNNSNPDYVKLQIAASIYMKDESEQTLTEQKFLYQFLQEMSKKDGNSFTEADLNLSEYCKEIKGA